MIVHIPHSSHSIPASYQEYFVLSRKDLEHEQLRMVDAYTDELFSLKESESVVFHYSRLLVDVERFAIDECEPMSQVGMGVIYTRTSEGKRLKRDLSSAEKAELIELYDRHHMALTTAVRGELGGAGRAMIVDCHSFPSQPLPCDGCQHTPRPDFCLGSDDFHTPPELVAALKARILDLGYSVAVNEPYAGTLVPSDYFQSDFNVQSVMIEVNRALYMDESTGVKLSGFDDIKVHITELLSIIDNYEEGENKALIQSYEQAKYIIEVDGDIELRVGEYSEKLDKLMAKCNMGLAAFITPDNPYSQQLTEVENTTRRESFLNEVKNLGNQSLEPILGYGVDDAELWPREKSYLVAVTGEAQAKMLAASFGQNAYLLCQQGEPVSLVLTLISH